MNCQLSLDFDPAKVKFTQHTPPLLTEVTHLLENSNIYQTVVVLHATLFAKSNSVMIENSGMLEK